MSKKIVEQLKSGVVEVNFIKRDGTNRSMNCTLSAEYIPASQMPKGGFDVDGNVLAVYDLDAKGFKSFRVDSVTSFSPYKW